MIGLSLELAETSYIPEYMKAKPAAASKKNNAATVVTIVVTLERGGQHDVRAVSGV